jgi:hypothetical protein
MHPTKMAELKLVRGRAILLKGKKVRDTLAIAVDGDTCDAEGLQMGRVIWKNLRVHLGDIFCVHPAEDFPNCGKAVILRFRGAMQYTRG